MIDVPLLEFQETLCQMALDVLEKNTLSSNKSFLCAS